MGEFFRCLEDNGRSISSRLRSRAALLSFTRWASDEYGEPIRNPFRDVVIPAQALLAPRELSPDQRYILKHLVERTRDPRAEAIFALGYWAGCRVSDVSWLGLADTRVGPRTGSLTVGHKGGKTRTIDLANEARQPLFAYLDVPRAAKGRRASAGEEFAFTSQRGGRLTESGIHQWFQSLRARATEDEWPLVADVSFHDLRHDWAHRARTAGWKLEEVAYYLGHVTRQGLPAIRTTARYTQASREQVRLKLPLVRALSTKLGWLGQ